MGEVFGGGGVSQSALDATKLGAQRVLFSLTGANLNSTSDQQFTKAFTFNQYIIIRVTATNASGAITLATGGIYPQPSKAGTAVVSAAQAWTGLTGTTATINPGLTATGNSLRSDSLYLGLTTAMGSAGTCDITIEGVALN